MEGHFSIGQSPEWAVVPMEDEVESLHTIDGKKFGRKVKGI